ncbi:undecaprenyldiphospho-muramoylpentapeptide beta-N-acetylglucosaminyltransferase [Brucella abortus]|nr:undecaprenyldiphospho-muramoylpentapeptide beta-N-acetylglucosaminyltransferase [Brucella abortus]
MDNLANQGVIVLAAGGTGGHLFPAEALAHELRARGWDVHLATDARAQRFVGAFAQDHVHVIRSATIAGRNPVALLKTFWSLWQGNLDSRKLFRRLKPKLVVGFGGYPTLPPLYAASNMGIPTLIHEQNAVMGRANKGLAGRVKAIAGGFLPENSGAYAAKTVITGNPVRSPVLVAAATPYTPAGKDDRFRLLVFGGSQGAQFFSQAIPAAVALLPEHERARLLITQQARKEDEASARQAYEKLGVPADVAPSSTICLRAWRTRILSSRAPVRLRFQKSPSSGGLPCWCRFPMRSITIRRPMQPHLRLRAGRRWFVRPICRRNALRRCCNRP